MAHPHQSDDTFERELESGSGTTTKPKQSQLSQLQALTDHDEYLRMLYGDAPKKTPENPNTEKLAQTEKQKENNHTPLGPEHQDQIKLAALRKRFKQWTQELEEYHQKKKREDQEHTRQEKEYQEQQKKKQKEEEEARAQQSETPQGKVRKSILGGGKKPARTVMTDQHHETKASGAK